VGAVLGFSLHEEKRGLWVAYRDRKDGLRNIHPEAPVTMPVPSIAPTAETE
jgi:hypothetical protein